MAEAPLVNPGGWQLPELTDPEMQAFTDYFNAHVGGVHKYSPTKCHGPSCQFAADCPLLRLGKSVPIDRNCPLELTLIRQYMQTMIDELQIQKGNSFDLSTVGAIAINQVLLKRVLDALSSETPVVDHFRGLTREGDAVFERKMHPAFDRVERLQDQMQRLQSDLMATRREKSKDNLRKRMSPSEQAKRLKDRLDAARKGVAESDQKLLEHYGIVDAEFKAVDAKVEATAEEPRQPAKPIIDLETSGLVKRPERLQRDPRTGFLVRS